jgi:hypothetical protein
MNRRAVVARAARFYRSFGLCPIPSRSDVKGPALRSGELARFRDGEPIPELWTEDAHWFGDNIQLVCGTAWRLAVIDLDGYLAEIVWRRWVRDRGAPRTWTVRTGGGGVHLYYTLPPGLPACPSRRIWGLWDATAKGWTKHQFVEVLGDRSLAIAPPSRHVDTGTEYRFLVGPGEIPRPAPIPIWLLDMPKITRHQTEHHMRGAPRDGGRRHKMSNQSLKRHDCREVLARLSEGAKLELAVGWGLRLASESPNAAGWHSCHAVGREDRHPSASFHPESGYYWTCDEKLSLFDLAVALGAYDSWQEACDAIGEATT